MPRSEITVLAISPREELHATTAMTKKEYLHIYALVGAAMEVYNQLGRGMEEPIYQEALQKELILRSIPFEREKPLKMWYKGELMDKTYYADFFSEEVIIELKSVKALSSEHRSQLFNYMRICNVPFGLLINFGERYGVRCERYIYLPEDDDFLLLNEENYKAHIEE